MVFIDTEDAPCERPGDPPCLNCGKEWGYHNNWACPASGYPDTYHKSQIPADRRFLTKDMQVASPPPRQFQKGDKVRRTRLSHNDLGMYKGHVYILHSVRANDCEVEGILGTYFNLNHFELVSSAAPKVDTSPATATDLSDWRAWRGTPPPGCCACGIQKNMCAYHKED